MRFVYCGKTTFPDNIGLRVVYVFIKKLQGGCFCGAIKCEIPPTGSTHSWFGDRKLAGCHRDNPLYETAGCGWEKEA